MLISKSQNCLPLKMETLNPPRRNVAKKSTSNRPLKNRTYTLDRGSSVVSKRLDHLAESSVSGKCFYNTKSNIIINKDVLPQSKVDALKPNTHYESINYPKKIVPYSDNVLNQLSYEESDDDDDIVGVFTISEGILPYFNEANVSPIPFYDSSDESVDPSTVLNYPYELFLSCKEPVLSVSSDISCTERIDDVKCDLNKVISGAEKVFSAVDSTEPAPDEMCLQPLDIPGTVLETKQNGMIMGENVLLMDDKAMIMTFSYPAVESSFSLNHSDKKSDEICHIGKSDKIYEVTEVDEGFNDIDEMHDSDSKSSDKPMPLIVCAYSLRDDNELLMEVSSGALPTEEIQKIDPIREENELPKEVSSDTLPAENINPIKEENELPIEAEPETLPTEQTPNIVPKKNKRPKRKTNSKVFFGSRPKKKAKSPKSACLSNEKNSSKEQYSSQDSLVDDCDSMENSKSQVNKEISPIKEEKCNFENRDILPTSSKDISLDSSSHENKCIEDEVNEVKNVDKLGTEKIEISDKTDSSVKCAKTENELDSKKKTQSDKKGKKEINEGVLLHVEAVKETQIMRDGRILKDKEDLLKDIESKIEKNLPVEVKDFDIQQSLTEEILLEQALRLAHQRTSPRRRPVLTKSQQKNILNFLSNQGKYNTRSVDKKQIDNGLSNNEERSKPDSSTNSHHNSDSSSSENPDRDEEPKVKPPKSGNSKQNCNTKNQKKKINKKAKKSFKNNHLTSNDSDTDNSSQIFEDLLKDLKRAYSSDDNRSEVSDTCHSGEKKKGTKGNKHKNKSKSKKSKKNYSHGEKNFSETENLLEASSNENVSQELSYSEDLLNELHDLENRKNKRIPVIIIKNKRVTIANKKSGKPEPPNNNVCLQPKDINQLDREISKKDKEEETCSPTKELVIPHPEIVELESLKNNEPVSQETSTETDKKSGSLETADDNILNKSLDKITNQDFSDTDTTSEDKQVRTNLNIEEVRINSLESDKDDMKKSDVSVQTVVRELTTREELGESTGSELIKRLNVKTDIKPKNGDAEAVISGGITHMETRDMQQDVVEVVDMDIAEVDSPKSNKHSTPGSRISEEKIEPQKSSNNSAAIPFLDGSDTPLINPDSCQVSLPCSYESLLSIINKCKSNIPAVSSSTGVIPNNNVNSGCYKPSSSESTDPAPAMLPVTNYGATALLNTLSFPTPPPSLTESSQLATSTSILHPCNNSPVKPAYTSYQPLAPSCLPVPNCITPNSSQGPLISSPYQISISETSNSGIQSFYSNTGINSNFSNYSNADPKQHEKTMLSSPHFYTPVQNQSPLISPSLTQSTPSMLIQENNIEKSSVYNSGIKASEQTQGITSQKQSEKAFKPNIPLSIIARDPRLRNKKVQISFDSSNNVVVNLPKQSNVSADEPKAQINSERIEEKNSVTEVITSKSENVEIKVNDKQEDSPEVNSDTEHDVNIRPKKKSKKREIDHELLYKTPLSDLHDVPERSSYARTLSRRSRWESGSDHKRTMDSEVPPDHRRRTMDSEVLPDHRRRTMDSEVLPDHRRRTMDSEVQPDHRRRSFDSEVPPDHRRRTMDNEVPAVHWRRNMNSDVSPDQHDHHEPYREHNYPEYSREDDYNYHDGRLEPYPPDTRVPEPFHDDDYKYRNQDHLPEYRKSNHFMKRREVYSQEVKTTGDFFERRPLLDHSSEYRPRETQSNDFPQDRRRQRGSAWWDYHHKSANMNPVDEDEAYSSSSKDIANWEDENGRDLIEGPMRSTGRSNRFVKPWAPHSRNDGSPQELFSRRRDPDSRRRFGDDREWPHERLWDRKCDEIINGPDVWEERRFRSARDSRDGHSRSPLVDFSSNGKKRPRSRSPRRRERNRGPGRGSSLDLESPMSPEPEENGLVEPPKYLAIPQ